MPIVRHYTSHRTALAEQFETLEQQQHADQLGLWLFLATEVMFFGGLFLGYIVYRHTYPEAFAAGSRHCNLLLGTLNTALLLTSSLTMALAVHAAEKANSKLQVRYLLITIFFGLGFLAIKGLEYSEHIRDHFFPGASFTAQASRQTELFFYFYFAMTGLHALHVLIGLGVLAVMTFLVSTRRLSPEHPIPVELTGLYWHFVDIVWVFLYPLIYLINRHA